MILEHLVSKLEAKYPSMRVFKIIRFFFQNPDMKYEQRKSCYALLHQNKSVLMLLDYALESLPLRGICFKHILFR